MLVENISSEIQDQENQDQPTLIQTEKVEDNLSFFPLALIELVDNPTTCSTQSQVCHLEFQ